MTRVFLSFAAMTLIIGTSCNQKLTAPPTPVIEAPAPPPPMTYNLANMKNATDSFCLAAGVNIAYNLQDQGLKNLNADLIAKAMEMVFNNDTTLNMSREESLTVLQQKLKEFADEKAAKAKAASARFLEENKLKPGVISLANGLQYTVLVPGITGGMMPNVSDTVVVHYVGTLTDGTEFDNSVKGGVPATFPLNGVIKGWTEILQLMPKGSKWKVIIPSELGYGDRGAGGVIPPNATLIFDIELLDVKKAITK